MNVLKADGTNATNHNGTKEAIVFTDCTIQDIKQLCTNVQAAITAKVDINKTAEANPFSGCSNLDKIAFDGDCENYYVNNEGDLYNSSDVLICSPEGKVKGTDRRALGTLIEQMNILTSQVGTYNAIGKANKIALQVEQGNEYYIWCNAPQSGNDGNVGNLLDGNGGTFFHSNWESTTAPADGLDHHLTIELGNENLISNFKFYYKARSGNNLGDYPTTIKVQGSIDGTNYTDIQTVTPKNANGNHIVNGAEWTSDIISDGNYYKYLRFMVTGTTTNKKKDGHIFFHMAEFELYYMTSTADVYSFLESGITNEQAETAYDAMLEAKAVFDLGTTAEQMQNAKTKLQNAYDTLNGLLKAMVPVTLTTDEANPVLYKIFIKRTADVTVLKYDETDNMVAVQDKVDNNTWQVWYFMLSTNGITIHPYNADGKVLSADNTSNDPAKVWATEKGEKAFYEWLFVKQVDGYWNIQAHDKSNYFSNNGGTGNKMGFWKTDPHSDGGSLFKFIEANFSNDNPRFYQLSDVKATLVDGTNIYGGTSVGLYTGGKEYREAYTCATALVNAGKASASDDCHNAYKALRSASKNLSYNEVDENSFYLIKSVANNDYCKDKYVYTCYPPTTRHRGNYTGTHDHRHLIFDAVADIPQMPLAIFQFEKTGTQGQYKMKNLHTGLYVKSFAKNEELMGSAQQAQVITIAGIADGQVTLKIGTNDPMHAQNDYGVIVQWTAAPGNASVWSIDEVADNSAIKQTVSVSSVGYSTLFLNYPVTIPDGLTAYQIGTIENNVLKMEEVSGSIPALTAVVLNGAEGSYDFVYTPAENNSRLTAILSGTLYKQTMAKEEGSKYYVLAYVDPTDDGIDNKKVGFYQATLGGDKTQFNNAANKAYLKVSESNDEARAAFLAFDFDGEETDIKETGNENVTGENVIIIDLQGRRLQKISKPGMYIVNGKKLLMK